MKRLLLIVVVINFSLSGVYAKDLVKVAAAQMLTTFDVKHNFEKIKDNIVEASKQGCEIILFHEGCLVGYPHKQQLEKIDFKKVTQYEKEVVKLAKKHHIAVLLGTASKEPDGYHNYILIINEEGKILGGYDKTWRAAEPWYVAGKGPVVFTVADVDATVFICHDLRYPNIARLGVAAGAKIVFIANNESGLMSNKLLGYRSMQISRATENFVYVVMSNCPADPYDVKRGTCSHGNSKIVTPMGNIVDEADSFEERLVIGTLNLKSASGGTVMRTTGKKISKQYGVNCENEAYANWMKNGLKLVRSLDGSEIPYHLK